MGKKVTLSTLESVNWPACCAKCISRSNLTWASATSGRVTSVSPTLGGAVRIKSELLDLSYPVCEEHAKGLVLANFLTRNTFGFKMLRGFIYLMAPMSVIVLVTLLARLIMHSPNAAGMPVGMAIVYVFFVAAFVAIMISFRMLPLRISKQTENGTTITIGNTLYANEFVKLNRQNIASR